MSSNNNNESKPNNNGRKPLHYPSLEYVISDQKLAEVQKIMSIQRKADTIQIMRETSIQQAINK